jgi:hypothetical protein
MGLRCSACSAQVPAGAERCPKCLRKSTLTSEAPPPESIVVRPRVFWYVALVVLGAISAGIITALMIYSQRVWPRIVDTEGITMRNGMFLPWSALTEATGASTTGVEIISLSFGATDVSIVAAMGPRHTLRALVLRMIEKQLVRR